MPTESDLPQSILEQIFAEMFPILEERDEFDDQLIARLKEMAAGGQLKVHAQVAKVLEEKPRVPNESS